jgi:hypothetical protein
MSGIVHFDLSNKFKQPLNTCWLKSQVLYSNSDTNNNTDSDCVLDKISHRDISNNYEDYYNIDDDHVRAS